MNQLLKEKLIHRLKSFGWRLGGMVAIAVVAFVANPENLKLLGLTPAIIVFLGLIANEITKFLNSNLPELRKTTSRGVDV